MTLSSSIISLLLLIFFMLNSSLLFKLPLWLSLSFPSYLLSSLSLFFLSNPFLFSSLNSLFFFPFHPLPFLHLPPLKFLLLLFLLLLSVSFLLLPILVPIFLLSARSKYMLIYFDRKSLLLQPWAKTYQKIIELCHLFASPENSHPHDNIQFFVEIICLHFLGVVFREFGAWHESLV